jgi:hypothetical protein
MNVIRETIPIDIGNTRAVGRIEEPSEWWNDILIHSTEPDTSVDTSAETKFLPPRTIKKDDERSSCTFKRRDELQASPIDNSVEEKIPS